MKTLLYLRSSFSLLRSTIKIEEACIKLKEMGYCRVALTDYKVLSGSICFYNAAKNAGLIPLFGLEIPVDLNGKIVEAVLYARNDEGFRNLMHLSTFLNTKEATIKAAELKNYLKDNLLSIFSDNDIFKDDIPNALALLDANFDKYVIGMSDGSSAGGRKLNAEIKPLLTERKIMSIVTDRAYYLDQSDEKAYAVLKAIGDKKQLDDKDFVYERGHYVKTMDELTRIYEHDDLLMSEHLADNLKIDLILHKTSLPDYYHQTAGDIKNPQAALTALAIKGLKRRLNRETLPDQYQRRLKMELDVIIGMHFANYFLIVYDLVNNARRMGIMVGPGRGSAAGSLVAYALHITEIDPLRYNLYFERFLNPERISMPDIDIDFPDRDRDKMIDYVKEKYGKDHVAHIVTYGTLGAKQVLRDVARVLNYPSIDALAKMVPNDLKITLKRAYNESENFQKKIERDELSRELFKIALKLEGLPRHYSTHAAGIVLSKEALSDIVPLVRVEQDIDSTGFTMEYLESIGLIKMDFLGLKNLSIIADVIKAISQTTPFDLQKIPLDDHKTFKLIKNVDTLGIFQLESAGMQNLIRKLQPATFSDIAVTIALFRPGPMENIPLFLKNRRNPDNIHYLHSDLIPILKDTSGIIIYQEQIMTIARKMASFSYGKADIMRRAMSKKKYDELSGLETEFIAGCLKNGYSEKLAKDVYALIMKFANYGFNKSHSIAYALIAYQQAYLKANYPMFFYTALLNGAINSQTMSASYLNECQRVKQQVAGPDINLSENRYIVKGTAIVMPLCIIKNIGTSTADKIITERRQNGPFHDFSECVFRLKNCDSRITETILASLIDAGAFDCFKLNRKTMNVNLHKMWETKEMLGALSLLGDDFSFQLTNCKEDVKERIKKEKEVLGFVFSTGSIIRVKEQFGYDTKSLYEIGRSYGLVKGFGIIKSIKEYTTKTGEKMCFLKVFDDSGEMDLSIKPSLYHRMRDDLVAAKQKYLYFEGQMYKEYSCRADILEIKE